MTTATFNKSLINLFASPRFKEAGPVARVKMIATVMRNKSRSEVIEVCVAKRINRNTARTQYQAWFAARKAA